ncbi:MAG: hypothetical protein RIC89_06185 [Pseudomonadales bacterium]
MSTGEAEKPYAHLSKPFLLGLDDDIPDEFLFFCQAFNMWTSTLNEFVLDPGALSETCTIEDPVRAARQESIVSWRLNTDLIRAKHLFQTETNQCRFAFGLSDIQGYQYSKGDQITVTYLWEARHDTELLVDLLFVGSLFPRLESSRKYYPRENWPRLKIVRECRKSMLYLIRDRLPEFESWPKLCTDVLPVRVEDDWYLVEDTNSLWRLLAEEHARLYCRFRLLKIEFTATGSRTKLQ